jgi:hypothetical protein
VATQQKITEVTNSRHIAQLIGSTIKSFQNKEILEQGIIQKAFVSKVCTTSIRLILQVQAHELSP